MPITVLGGTTSAAAAFEVANSCRFNEPDSAYMSRTLGTATNAKKFTISFWIKRCNVGNYEVPFECGTDGNNFGKFYFHEGGTLRFYQASSGSAQCSLTTNQLFRDPTAWMHIVMAVDTTQGTAGNRNKLYINGTQVTSFSTETNFGEDDTGSFNGAVLHTIGRDGTGTTDYLDAYLAEFVFIDGTQYAASDFGEFDEDSPTIWKPKDVSGLTFGNNGAYLDFEDSGNLGDDESGNTNDWAETNLAAADQSTDSPSNNFATMNPLHKPPDANTFSEGNCQVVTHSDNYFGSASTIGVASGKWYFEVEFDSGASIGMAGITSDPDEDARGDKHLGKLIDSYGIYGNSGNFLGPSDGSASYGSAISDGEIVGVYMDLDNNKIYFAVDGSLVSTTGKSIVAPASTANTGLYFFGVGDGSSGSVTMKCNFGGCSAFAISSGNTDANGYGNFEFDPSAGTFDGASKDFLALCTKNLATDG